ncbi:Uncharacterized protein dnm_066860 [Desulfonema magnum]|uniref:Uncharacterized protein n=1 Tax=Desulfonema magnum TaxID=45655 RepID=A0A975BT49_9BACT|nr:Uncharacterized protein dnm_066860 [Desulfonema magnum]
MSPAPVPWLLPALQNHCQYDLFHFPFSFRCYGLLFIVRTMILRIEGFP